MLAVTTMIGRLAPRNGAGGILLNGDGERFMFGYDERGERATRANVSAAEVRASIERKVEIFRRQIANRREPAADEQ